MLTHKRSDRCGWSLRTTAVLIGAASALAGAAGPGTQPSAVELKPAAIVLDVVPQAETKASCVLRYRGQGGMTILSVESSDSGLSASWRKGVAPGLYVVTATFPAGYSVPEGSKVELLVKAEVQSDRRPTGARAAFGSEAQARREAQGSPGNDKTTPHVSAGPAPRREAESQVIRIPVLMGAKLHRPNEYWLTEGRALVGRPAPLVSVERLQADGTASDPHATSRPAGPAAFSSQGGHPDLHIGSPVTDGRVTVLMFAAHWCGHCDEHVPGLVRLNKEYANRVGEAVNFVAVLPTTGNGGAVKDAVKRWELVRGGAGSDDRDSSPAEPAAASEPWEWTLAIDRG